MDLRSKLLSILLAPAIVAGSAPAAAQPSLGYALVRANAEQARTERRAAIERCAASIAAASTPVTRFDIVGYEHPVNGNLRVHGIATFSASPNPVEVSCDVDPRGNLRRLNLAAR